ncbi:MAG: hypothetical protein L0Z50_08990 [Verrucomicrobiales bacterium]|nr:hypothetical protein [Verrucomicrobiales bacterium]
MASHFDESDFVDADYQNAKSAYATTTTHSSVPAAITALNRPPTREELETKVNETQQRLEELRRAQEELQRERVVLEEARRRRVEFQTGREEMLQNLTRGIGLLEEAEFNARRDAEQMARTLGELREHIGKVQAITEESWTQENLNMELTRALTTVENARNEWNSARLKWALLNGPSSAQDQPRKVSNDPFAGDRSFLELCKMGLALTWPVALVGLIGFILLLLFGRV